MEENHIKAEVIDLTLDDILKITPKDILYAEVAETGAMGKVGGVMIYIIRNKKLLCYHSNYYKDALIYSKARELLFPYIPTPFDNKIIDDNLIYCNGGFGNHVFLSKTGTFNIKDEQIIYYKNDKGYIIHCSVQGVHDKLKDEIKIINDLNRFVNAQQSVYQKALEEITKGKKQSHWMWYIFPQMIGLGTSSTAKQFGVKNIEEARSFLEHSILGPRLIEITTALLSLDESNPHIIFGYPDNLKLQSSMTLF